MKVGRVIFALCWLSLACCASIALRTTECPENDLISPCTCELLDSVLSLYVIRCNGLQSIDALNTIVTNISNMETTLVVESSNITYFPPAALSNSSIHAVRLKNCSLTSSAPDNSISESVNILLLEQVTTTQDWFFDRLPNLKYLYVHNSTFGGENGPKFAEFLRDTLEFLSIAESNVTTIEELSLKNKTKLFNLRLSHNKLTTLDASALPSSLESLELDFNRISSIPEGTFSHLPHLTRLSLSSNSISSLPEEVFKDLWKPSVSVELRGNPIKCDCRMLWAVTSETKPMDLTGQCAHPKSLFGKELKDLTPDDLNCPGN